MTMMYDLAREQKYNFLIERCRLYPEEAKYVADNGSTTLHWLVYDNAPFEAVKAVYHAYPEAIEATNRHGNNPLDVAMQCSSKEVVDFLRKAPMDPKKAYIQLENEVQDLRLQNIELFDRLSKLEKKMFEQQECIDLLTIDSLREKEDDTQDHLGNGAKDDEEINQMMLDEQERMRNLKLGANDAYMSRHPSIHKDEYECDQFQ